MKQPTKAEYDATVDDAGVHVVHRPTESHYDYYLLADGGLSLPPSDRITYRVCCACSQPVVAHRVNSRQRSNSVPFEAKRTFGNGVDQTQPKDPAQIILADAQPSIHQDPRERGPPAVRECICPAFAIVSDESPDGHGLHRMGEDADRRVIDAGRGAEQDHSILCIKPRRRLLCHARAADNFGLNCANWAL
jgi:hypothetical protein